MHRIRRTIETIFVLTLAALLLGGVLFVTGQAIAIVADALKSRTGTFATPAAKPSLVAVTSTAPTFAASDRTTTRHIPLNALR